VSAHVHTPISGTVVKIDTARTPQGMPVEAIYIKSDEADREADAAAMADTKPKRSDAEIAALDSKAIIELIKDAGIVGDDMLMRENAREIVKGVQLLVRAAGVNRAVIAIENNKPEAIAAMTEACASAPGIEVMTMQVKYPQGGEKQLIAAVTGREVPSGALPIATGCIVQNVATAYAVYRAVYHNEPILDRVLTLHDGNEGKNLRVPLGTMLSTLVEPGMEYEKIILGGPMMGRTASTLNTPMIKGTSGILLDPRYAHRREPEPCIRCAAWRQRMA